MTKEKLVSLTKYVLDLKAKLETAVPEKHKNNPTTYHNFLRNEIRMTTIKLEAAKLEGTVK
jgi:hypothetical protein